MNLPFFPLRSYFETDLPVANPLIRPDRSRPTATRRIYAVPPLRPDVTIVHAQRASAGGDTQVWGLLGCQKEAAFAADRVIVVVEELVDEAVIRADPEPDDHPGADRGRGRRRAVGRASLVRPGCLRPRQPLLPRLGSRSPATRRASRRGSANGSTASRIGASTWPSSATSGWRRCARPASAPSGSVDYGEYR